MTRSSYKSPFISNKLLINAINAKNNNINEIYTRSRSSTITFDFVGFIVHVYNGKKYFPLSIKENMVGYKFGDFIFTKKKMIFRKKKKKKK
jgi:small subunit ribosomal protein S19